MPRKLSSRVKNTICGRVITASKLSACATQQRITYPSSWPENLPQTGQLTRSIHYTAVPFTSVTARSKVACVSYVPCALIASRQERFLGNYVCSSTKALNSHRPLWVEHLRSLAKIRAGEDISDPRVHRRTLLRIALCKSRHVSVNPRETLVRPWFRDPTHKSGWLCAQSRADAQ